MSASLQLAKDLLKQVNQSQPDASICQSLLEGLYTAAVSQQIPIHKIDTFTNTLHKAQKAFRVQKRSARVEQSKTVNTTWERLLKGTDRLLVTLQQLSKQPSSNEANREETTHADPLNRGLPSTVNAYLTRLKQQKKELYKDPPVLPPPAVVIEARWVGTPQRNTRTGILTFACGKDGSLQSLLNEFHPNRTPEEILRDGAFGGTYFRSITSAVTNQHYSGAAALRDTVPQEWIEGLDQAVMLTSSTYRESVNKYKVKCGGSLGMWESSGWISDADPYGWFQWFCRFYQGRRCSDDARQIQRWKGVAGTKGRFRSQLCNKIVQANAKCDDVRISPVIRQTLFHWGLVITDDILDLHKKRR